RIDPAPVAPLPQLDQVRQSIARSRDASASFLARDPRVRAEIVEREGGTTLTEAAVARGLRWLASVQNQDGSWGLANYDLHQRASNRGDAAATSLALLPFLGAGQTHEYGIYKQTVARGLEWLIVNQKPDGDLRANFERQAGMYAHGQAAIVLCEVYALTGDERMRDPAQRAINFIQQAQHREGGWRYQPGQAGDTSVFGWQVMALQSARASGGNLAVDADVLSLADYYLDLASSQRSRDRNIPEGALYRYLPREGPLTASMTAEAILCRMYLGWRRDDPRLMFAIRWLLENHLPGTGEADIYYWYYATQAMHHYGGDAWQTWNLAMRDMLVDMQETSGKHPGSWNPKQFRWGAEGERIFVTSLAICTLEVYYRHLPIFRQLKLD
ncbi:MAG TPA: terpene cyclase/mutase family protein, partial [Pirellulaceae bacterium]|nr:terpene cyclase/mutase family protein [Pirellulaceae bacterium]